jgi:hypothetical protein
MNEFLLRKGRNKVSQIKDKENENERLQRKIKPKEKLKHQIVNRLRK